MSLGALYFSVSLTCQGLSLQSNDRLQTVQRHFVLVIGRIPDSWKDACCTTGHIFIILFSFKVNPRFVFNCSSDGESGLDTPAYSSFPTLDPC